ncbi:hypothetical protein FB451DRAFT_181483 [Mycena latifolia]|nr:hypothetical protein FB451DRAFT_181483 [Mycena latifolia]
MRREGGRRRMVSSRGKLSSSASYIVKLSLLTHVLFRAPTLRNIFNRPRAQSPRDSPAWEFGSDSNASMTFPSITAGLFELQPPHPAEYQQPYNLPDHGRQVHPTHRLDWDRVESAPNFERSRRAPDHDAHLFCGQSRHEGPQIIHGGTFVTAEHVNHRHGEAGIHILHHAVALEALHDSAESFPQPKCHPETRTEILDNLYSWAIDYSSSYSIRWLHGPAGAGKSAVMQTLSQRLHHAERLGGSFFFKRGHTTRGSAKVLFATLAYQLALHCPKLSGPISRSAETDPSVVGRGMDVQLRSLILEPCKSLKDVPAPILLIDGLDECEAQSAQQEILSLIGSTANAHPRPLRILISSRPESHIREKFEESSFDGLYDSVNIEQAFDDVRIYLRDEFSRIHRQHHETMEHIPTPWPSTDILEKLVENSSGYFIYAATVIKFIDDKCFRPTKQLEVIQSLNIDDSDSPFAALDQLYMQILSAVPPRSRSNLCDILCVIANFQLLPEQIDMLLGLEPGDVWLILRCLKSVLKMSSKQHVIHVYHASFLDFLKNEGRSSVFHVGSQHHTKLARGLLNTLAYTHEDRQINRAGLFLPWYARST